MKQTLKKLVETFGPSGHEQAVRDVINSLVSECADEIRTDALGNLIVRKKGSGKKVMLAAHMDEIGLIVSYIDKNGFARINPVGGVRTLYEVCGRVLFENGTVGVIGMEKMGGSSQAPPIEKLFVDVAASSPETCPVRVGDVGCFLQPMVQTGGHLTAKAMDDRVGCAILIEVIRKLKVSPYDLYFVFSAQEEVGTRGAVTSAFGIRPDVGIAVDVTLTGDTPEPQVKMAVSLDKGPAIKVKDSGMLATPWVKDWMIDTAESGKIPYQLEVLLGGTTDARAIQTSRAGVPVGCLSVPCRYVHSPSETVSYADVRHTVKLLAALLSSPVHPRLA
ncbi:MAG: M42 family metallopeptidase [Kiritimatiellaeota bacterium]|nr:M42 family metallopeptidase [Kiritimatiellota bacterium]